jgi:protein AbiQ
LQFKRLSTTFVEQTKNLLEVLEDKGRGYCTIQVKYKDLLFAVPLRSNLNHTRGKALKIGGAPVSFITDPFYDSARKCTCYRGLDYQKALLLSDPNEDFSSNYPLPDNNQKTLLRDNEHKITKQFRRYVDSYKRGCNQSLPYKRSFYKSTLVNYHSLIGVKVSYQVN